MQKVSEEKFLHESTKDNLGCRISDLGFQIGIVVDAGANAGHGHLVRCLRLAARLADFARVVFYPLSETCQQLLAAANSGFAMVSPKSRINSFPPLVITDVHEPHGISAVIHRHGSRHVSIHDLGLAQCRSDVAIDGSIVRLFPYMCDKDRELYIGPQYMITRNPVQRREVGNTVLLALGAEATFPFEKVLTESLRWLGLNVARMHGFSKRVLGDEHLEQVIATCRFAIADGGSSLYDLLACGVPTIGVAHDPLELRTADAFQEFGAVLSAGLIQRLTPVTLLRYCEEMLSNGPLSRRLSHAGKMLVDGKGLARVVGIVRRQLSLATHSIWRPNVGATRSRGLLARAASSGPRVAR